MQKLPVLRHISGVTEYRWTDESTHTAGLKNRVHALDSLDVVLCDQRRGSRVGRLALIHLIGFPLGDLLR